MSYIKYQGNYFKIIRETKNFIVAGELLKEELSFRTKGVSYMDMGEQIKYQKLTKVVGSEKKIGKKWLSSANIVNNIDEIIDNDDYYANGKLRTGYKNSLFGKGEYKKIENAYNYLDDIYSITKTYIINNKEKYENVKEVFIELLTNFKNNRDNGKYLNALVTILQEKKEIAEDIINKLKIIDDYIEQYLQCKIVNSK